LTQLGKYKSQLTLGIRRCKGQQNTPYLLLLLCFLNGYAWADDQRPKPSLTDVVLFATFPLSSLDSSKYAGEQRACVERYLSAAKPNLSTETKTNKEDQIIAIRRWRLERHIDVIHGPTARRDAGQFAAGVPLSLEWEGMSEGPLIEADYAEQWLKRYPQSPIIPFLHLFAAHRFRAGFEAAGRKHAKGLIPIAAAKYQYHLQAARSAKNDKIACIANDMEALPYVYLSGFDRP
jgi:hypothetical protein